MHTGAVHALDFDRDGKALSWICFPFSIDRSPYFQVRTPVCVVRNGTDPRILLMAGNHGDEYEGELSLARLIRRIEPVAMRGTLTILPTVNAPAVHAAKRCSPLDGGNLNRTFPGNAAGTPTQRLAHLLEHELFPRQDVVFDLHSGGTSMAHLPCVLIERDLDVTRQDKALSLLRLLGMPYGFVADNGPDSPTSMGAARRAGAIGLSGEFGGGATTTPASMAGACGAIDHLLLAIGMVDRPVLGTEPGPVAAMQTLSLSRHSQGLYADRKGWFEPAVDVGATVAAGQVAGWYHDLERPAEPEEPLLFLEGGIVISRRLHTMSERGDCLLQVAEPVP